MTIEVTLQVAPLDFRDSQIQEIVEALGDYDWANESGISTLTVFSEGDPVADTVRAIRCARARGIEVLRVRDERVNVGEIARRIGGITREAVRKWAQDPSFPLAVDSDGGERASLKYRWADVVQWLYDAKGIDMDEGLPNEKAIAAINAHIFGVRDFGSEAMHQQIAVTRTAKVIHAHFSKHVEWEVDVVDYDFKAQVQVSAR